MVIVTVILFFYNVELALHHAAPDRARSSPGSRSGSASASDKGYNRVRDGIAGVLSDLSESLSGVRVVTGFNRARHNVLQPPQRHRRVPRRQRLHRADRRDVRRVHRVRRAARPGRAAAHRRQHGARRHALRRRARRVHPLPELVLPADPAAGAAVQPVPAGPGRDHQARRAALDAPDASRRRTTREPLPPIEGDGHARATCRSATTRPSRCCATSTSTSRAGETIVVRRAHRRGQVDHRQARHPLLRPDRGAASRSTATTCATSPSTRCAASSAWSPRSRSSSRAPCATTSRSPGPTPPTTR